MKNPFIELQKYINTNNIDFLLIATFDPHGSEYINDYYKSRDYFSGFTGSNGLLLVTKEKGYLWTDGRYFIQAANELYKNIELMKMGEKNVPTIFEILDKNLKKDNIIAFDSLLISAAMGIEIERIANKKKAFIKNDHKFIDLLWKDRPADSCSKAYILDDKYNGMNISIKLKNIEKFIKRNNSSLFISKLDEIMWLLNIRGNDIMCNPVCYSYLFAAKENIYLFINKKALKKEVKEYLLNNKIIICDYQKTSIELEKILENTSCDNIQVDLRYLSYELYTLLNKKIIKDSPSPVDTAKAIKNKIEIKNLKECYLNDSAVVTKFIKYLKENPTISELKAAEVLDTMRSKLPGFLGLSFPTISAYGPNAAMMHYEATESKYSNLKPEGLYLVDSGGQYYTGTTDVTRTIALGKLTDKMKFHFTLTAIAMLRLMNSKFMDGCTGRNLDIISRQVMWEHGLDYKCGTGHGIGYLLNVHEGPQNIGWQKRANGIEAKLEKGMIISDEPGVYIEDEYGIRTENIVLVSEYKKTPDGHFLCFEPLTYVPIDLDAIEIKYMNEDDRKLLNNYHKMCYKKLIPYMNAEEAIWLKNITKKI